VVTVTHKQYVAQAQGDCILLLARLYSGVIGVPVHLGVCSMKLGIRAFRFFFFFNLKR
jgi:hypothetical protein